MIRRGTSTGHRHNHTADPDYFTDAYVHGRVKRPVAAGLTADLPVEESAGWQQTSSSTRLTIGKGRRLLQRARETEHFLDLMPVSAHDLVIAKS